MSPDHLIDGSGQPRFSGTPIIEIDLSGTHTHFGFNGSAIAGARGGGSSIERSTRRLSAARSG